MPTKDTDDKPVVEQLQVGEVVVNKDISRQRRKIIKASAAVVPAIMTIRSGAAAAAMTSINQCMDRDAARPAATSVMYSLDEWVRMAGLEIKSGNDTLYGVPTKGFPSPTNNGVTTDYTAWYDANGDTDKVAGNSTPTPYIDGVTSQEIGRGKRVYLLVYIDAADNYYWYPRDGALVGDAWATDGSQITGSCLCSVNPDLADLF